MKPARCDSCQALQGRVHDLQAENDRLRRQLGEAIHFGVILRKVWGGGRTLAGVREQAVLMLVWRTCWQQGRSALDFLSQLLRGTSVAVALPP